MLYKNIELGSTVRIKDGSYMTTAYDGKITWHGQNKTPIGLRKDLFRVIGINSTYPTIDNGDVLGYQNNCMIQSTTDGDIWYCSRINIENTEELF